MQYRVTDLFFLTAVLSGPQSGASLTPYKLKKMPLEGREPIQWSIFILATELADKPSWGRTTGQSQPRTLSELNSKSKRYFIPATTWVWNLVIWIKIKILLLWILVIGTGTGTAADASPSKENKGPLN
jgi:hypothetical protein